MSTKPKPYLWTLAGLVALSAVIGAWTGPSAGEDAQQMAQAEKVDWYEKMTTLPLTK